MEKTVVIGNATKCDVKLVLAGTILARVPRNSRRKYAAYVNKLKHTHIGQCHIAECDRARRILAAGLITINDVGICVPTTKPIPAKLRELMRNPPAGVYNHGA